MARFPLFPAEGNYQAWARALTQRLERDYAYLKPKAATLSLSPTTTNVITDINVETNSRIVITPITREAADTVLAGLYISSKSQGQFTIATSLSSTMQTGAVFDYAVFPSDTPPYHNTIALPLLIEPDAFAVTASVIDGGAAAIIVPHGHAATAPVSSVPIIQPVSFSLSVGVGG